MGEITDVRIEKQKMNKADMLSVFCTHGMVHSN